MSIFPRRNRYRPLRSWNSATSDLFRFQLPDFGIFGNEVVHLFVVGARVFLLLLAQRDIVRHATDAGVSARILLRELERHSDREDRDAPGPIKLDTLCRDVLLCVLRRVSGIPARLSPKAC